MCARVFTRGRFLPASNIKAARIDHAIISDGCIIIHANISHSIIGIRSIVGNNSELHRVIFLGGDYYESHASIIENEMLGRPRIGIGQNSRIENAIIDKNARIGDNVVITPAGKPENLAEIAKRYGVFYAKQKVDTAGGGYVVDHSSDTYMLGPDGQLLGKIAHATPPDQVAAEIRKRLNP